MPDCLALEDTCLNTFSLYLFFNTGETDNKKVNEKIAGDDKYQMMNIIRVMSWRTPGDFFFWLRGQSVQRRLLQKGIVRWGLMIRRSMLCEQLGLPGRERSWFKGPVVGISLAHSWHRKMGTMVKADSKEWHVRKLSRCQVRQGFVGPARRLDCTSNATGSHARL